MQVSYQLKKPDNEKNECLYRHKKVTSVLRKKMEMLTTSTNRLDFSSKYGIKSLFIRVKKCQKCVRFAEKALSSANPSAILIRLRRKSGSRIFNM
jgi:hypothetical protein